MAENLPQILSSDTQDGFEHAEQIDTLAVFNLMKVAESGPQAMQISEEDISEALNDPETLRANIKGVDAPILMPVSKIEAYASSGYFEHGAEEFMFMPVYADLSEEEVQSIHEIVKQSNLKSKTILSYYEDGDTKSEQYASLILNSLSDSYVQKPLIDEKVGTEVSITHFEGLAEVQDRSNLRTDITSLRQVFLEGVAEGSYEEHPQSGVALIDPEELKTDRELLDKLWRISDEQFSRLAENIPVRQNLNREEFDEMMTHAGTSSIIYFEDGEPICLATFLHSLESAEWLRKSYFDNKFGPDTFLSYFGFLVSDAKHSSYKSSHKVLKMLSELTVKARSDMQVLFESTNISETYVPKLVEGVVNSNDAVKIEINPSSRYTFKAYEVGRAE